MLAFDPQIPSSRFDSQISFSRFAQRIPSSRYDPTQHNRFSPRYVARFTKLFFLKGDTIHFMFCDYNKDGKSHTNVSIELPGTARSCTILRNIRNVYTKNTLLVSQSKFDKGFAAATRTILKMNIKYPFLMCPTYWIRIKDYEGPLPNRADIDLTTRRVMQDSQLAVTGKMTISDKKNIRTTALRELSEELGVQVDNPSKLIQVSVDIDDEKTMWTTFVVKVSDLKPYTVPIESTNRLLLDYDKRSITRKCQILVVGSCDEITELAHRITRRAASDSTEHDSIRSFVAVPYYGVTTVVRPEHSKHPTLHDPIVTHSKHSEDPTLHDPIITRPEHSEDPTLHDPIITQSEELHVIPHMPYYNQKKRLREEYSKK
jgi:hypothetical protein